MNEEPTGSVVDDRLKTFLRQLRGLSHVVRWNFYPRSRPETVAEHCFYTAIFAWLLAMKESVPEPKVVLAALVHDIEEAVTGDAPSLVKKHIPSWPEVAVQGLRELCPPSPIEFCWHSAQRSDLVKLADSLAALAYAQEQAEAGNQVFKSIERQLVYKIRKSQNQAAIDLMLEMGYGETFGEDFHGMSHLAANAK